MPGCPELGLAAVGAIILALAPAADIQNELLTIDEFMQIKTPLVLDLHPSSEAVLIEIAEVDALADRAVRRFYIVDEKTGLQQLALHEGASAAHWTASGDAIAYLADEGLTRQLFITSVSGQIEFRSEAPKGVQTFAISAEGAWFVSEGSCERGTAARMDEASICLLDAAGGVGRSWHLPFRTKALTVSSGGRYAALTVAEEYDSGSTDLWLIDLTDGRLSALATRPGADWLPVWSPDGRAVAFVSDQGGVGWKGSPRLSIVSIQDGAIKDFSDLTEGPPSSLTWPTENALLFSAPEGVERPLFQFDPRSGRVQRLPIGDLAVRDIDAEDHRVAFLAQSPMHPGDVYKLGEDDEVSRLTHFNRTLADKRFGNLQSYRWDAPDGERIEGLLLVPPLGRPPYPLIVYAHGGPGEVFSRIFNPQFGNFPFPSQVAPYPVHLYAAAGIAVLMPNPRGSLGYGAAFERQVVLDWGGADFADLITGVDMLIAEGIANEDRLGFMGWSYGGYLANWALTHEPRFVAISAGASISHIPTLMAETDQGQYLQNFFPPGARTSAVMHDRSPLTHVLEAKARLLLQHGASDTAVPAKQAAVFASALRRAMHPVELQVFIGEGHLVLSPSNQREMIRRNLEFFSEALIDPRPVSSHSYPEQDP